MKHESRCQRDILIQKQGQEEPHRGWKRLRKRRKKQGKALKNLTFQGLHRLGAQRWRKGSDEE